MSKNHWLICVLPHYFPQRGFVLRILGVLAASIRLYFRYRSDRVTGQTRGRTERHGFRIRCT